MPHYLIDGYNVIHAIPELKSVWVQHPEGHAARGHLLEMAVAILSSPNNQVSLIFDGKGDDLAMEHSRDDPSLAVIYTSKSQSADGCIEQMLDRSQHPEELIVVTGDNLICEAARARKAMDVSPGEFYDEVTSRRRLLDQILMKKRKYSDEDFGNRIPL